MKKILLTFTLVFMLLAIPVAADTPYQLIVNHEHLDSPVVIIDGTAYVPIRTVAEAFNATTEWYDATKAISITSKREIKRPPIEGDAEFVSKINAALDLLEQKDFPHYVLVCQNTWDIRPLLIANPAKEVKDSLAFNIWCSTSIMPLLINDPQRYTPTYLAGILTHEACHATTTKYDKPITEKNAYAHELTVFRVLDAPQWMQDECMNRDNE